MVETALTLHKSVYDGHTNNDLKKKSKRYMLRKDVNAAPEKQRWLGVTRCVEPDRIEKNDSAVALDGEYQTGRHTGRNGRRSRAQTPKQDGPRQV